MNWKLLIHMLVLCHEGEGAYVGSSLEVVELEVSKSNQRGWEVK